MSPLTRLALLLSTAGLALACSQPPPSNALTASGNVEATEVQVAPEVGGRIVELRVAEGDRVEPGAVIATLDTKDTELQIGRARAERAAAAAQLHLFEAGARAEDVRQAEAQVGASTSEIAAIDVEIASAQTDLDRFEALLAANAGSQKQRDDAKARVDLARERKRAAEERVRVARTTLDRVRAGARKEELEGARARVATVDARARDQAKLRAMIGFCQTASCRTRYILEHFGEPVSPTWRCGNCDACDEMSKWDERQTRRDRTRRRERLTALEPAGYRPPTSTG
jgi:HlyD family secretion protein